MVKLWKVIVRNFGWSRTVVRYFESECEAEQFGLRFHAHKIVYMGKVSDEKSARLQSYNK